MNGNRIARLFARACRAELDAVKPGNVHRFAPGHGMTVADFEISAEVAAPALARPGARLGRRILDAVEATRRAVGVNTNLGILLLCAPLAAAAERPGPLASAVAAVLAEADRDDARLVYEAIRRAAPVTKAARGMDGSITSVPAPFAPFRIGPPARAGKPAPIAASEGTVAGATGPV